MAARGVNGRWHVPSHSILFSGEGGLSRPGSRCEAGLSMTTLPYLFSTTMRCRRPILSGSSSATFGGGNPRFSRPFPAARHFAFEMRAANADGGDS